MSIYEKLCRGGVRYAADSLARVFIEGILNGIALATCEEGEEPEEVTREDIEEAMASQGDALTAKFLTFLSSEDTYEEGDGEE